MTIPVDVKRVMDKVVKACLDDPELLTDVPVEYDGRSDERAFTVQNLETISVNHLFDDNFEPYGITELEGCVVRHYFCNGAESCDFVLDLRRAYPDFFRCDEEGYYIDTVNDRRSDHGLGPISLDEE